MNTYEAYVRVQPNGFAVKTFVLAQSVSDAILLLKGQYGANNLLQYPVLAK
ncbi:MAG: hypothetical protein KGI88_07025 [Betaproteobacteria bacterium]|nr:hypothetical protein [Betaproteobacteria bacterium]